MNGDGYLDLVGTAPGKTWLFINTRDGNYDGGYGTQYDIALGDLNSDDMLDMIMLDNNGSIRVQYNEGSP